MHTYSEERKWVLYLHKNKINGKEYVGITSQIPEKRWGSNGTGYKGQRFYYAIKKYGWDNFDHIILKTDLTEKEAYDEEMEYISKNNLTKKGYNVSIGGEVMKCGAENPMSKPVIFDGVEYDSVSTLCKKFNFNSARIISYLNKKNRIPIELYVLGLRYKNVKMSSYKINIGDIKFTKEPIDEHLYRFINIDDKEVVTIDGLDFATTSHCAIYLNETNKSVINWLTGVVSMPKKYYDRGLRYKNSDNSRIYCREKDVDIKITVDNLIFNSYSECTRYLNEHGDNVSNWLNGKHAMPKGYYDRGLRYVDLDNSKIRCSKRETSGLKDVTVDGKIFHTIKECSNYLNISNANTVQFYLKGKSTMPIDLYNRGLRYVNEQLNKNIKIRDDKQTMVKNKVIIDGIIFSNAKECSNYVGNVSDVTFRGYLSGKVTMPKDLYNRGLRYVDESLNSNIRVRK